jgi:hypothetical protein
MANEYLIATFAEPASVVEAVTRIRAHGLKVYDVYSPCPVHGLDAAMGLRRSRLGYVAMAAGVMGGLAALGFQFYAAVFDWSMNIGGKPDNSTLAFVPITFELTILAAGTFTAKAFFARSGLFPGRRARLVDPRVTDDRFAVALRWRSTPFDTGEARRILRECGAIEIAQKVMEL